MSTMKHQTVGRGADPSNTFHELRRYLLSMGIDTRVSNFASIPIPTDLNQNRGKNKVVNADDLQSVDNSFLFELRRIFHTGSTCVNAVVFLVRVFFDADQCSKSFHMQIVANHKGHGLLEMNEAYHDVIDHLEGNGWTPVPHSEDIYALEKQFGCLYEFKKQFSAIYRLLHMHDILNNHGLPSQIQL